MEKIGVVSLLGDTDPPLETRNRFDLRKRSHAEFVKYVHERDVFNHPPGTESSDHNLCAVDNIFGDNGQTLEKTGELGVRNMDLAGTSYPFGRDDGEWMGSRASKKCSFHRVGHHRRWGRRVKRKELECVKSASSQPDLNFLIRKPSWTARRCSAFPEFLDRIKFELIGRTGEETSNIKQLLVPDYTGRSGLMHKEKEGADLPRYDHWSKGFIRQFRH